VEVDVKRVQVERSRKFGGPWLGLELLRRLELDRFLEETLPEGREEIPWPLDALLPHKPALEKHLKEKLGELFELDYDLLLYDVTSTYFEGQAEKNPQAQRGYSRDHRPDCKQVNIALVVSRCGMPLGYEIFAGNRHDATTLEEMVEHIEGLYGRASRIWAMDRGMAGEDNVEFLREGGRRYIVGTAKKSLRKFERELLAEDWRLVHAGLEVRITPAPGGEEVFILCRNTRAAALFDVRVEANASGFASLRWSKVEAWREWARLSEGCYVLRSNVTDWSPEDLWRAYIQLTEAEAAFRIHKSDLAIRKRCISQPTEHQQILLQRLGLKLPTALERAAM
jgi:hypothetical protein